MSSTKKTLQLAGALAALATLALAVSCRGFFPPEQLASMTISPSTPTVPLGGATQLSAFGTNTDGTSAGNITGKVTWTSSAATIAVTAGGLLKGNDLSATPATITALYQSVTATASATVVRRAVESITAPGGTTTYTCSASITGMPTRDVSGSVTWSVNDTSGNITLSQGVSPATVTTTSAAVPGTYTITATWTPNTTTYTSTAKLIIN